MYLEYSVRIHRRKAAAVTANIDLFMGSLTIAQNLECLERSTIHICDDNKVVEVNPLTRT